eukprot:TRINITY_DN9258_c0_g1_i2.p3 TRINITY_DN9258_c0_g1~~TRINITY_DN9258_c0_g1_i2.p3  ORF type:complete len:115 (+),score=20.02 TRINITY_DN9258_c0_g1_i2:100-444(+)
MAIPFFYKKILRPKCPLPRKDPSLLFFFVLAGVVDAASTQLGLLGPGCGEESRNSHYPKHLLGSEISSFGNLVLLLPRVVIEYDGFCVGEIEGYECFDVSQIERTKLHRVRVSG